ncbi:hypothetical protein ACN27E_08260 [Mycobacterium sp. WMMD1722]|uniref:hypothetical protein n=1 Tax=Mycobacterium sp. WMMD1722 TaxID=3404117 RepID=UPI003BF6118C
MPGIAEIALGAAPLAGGALLGLAAGGLKGPDIRGAIAKDMDLIERMTDEQADLKRRLQESVDLRISDLIDATEKSRALRDVAFSYRGNWRDIVVFVCALLFTFIWWNVKHSRPHWLMTFVVLVLLCILTAVYAVRGLIGAAQTFRANRRRGGT